MGWDSSRSKLKRDFSGGNCFATDGNRSKAGGNRLPSTRRHSHSKANWPAADWNRNHSGRIVRNSRPNHPSANSPGRLAGRKRHLPDWNCRLSDRKGDDAGREGLVSSRRVMVPEGIGWFPTGMARLPAGNIGHPAGMIVRPGALNQCRKERSDFRPEKRIFPLERSPFQRENILICSESTAYCFAPAAGAGGLALACLRTRLRMVCSFLAAVVPLPSMPIMASIVPLASL